MSRPPKNPHAISPPSRWVVANTGSSFRSLVCALAVLPLLVGAVVVSGPAAATPDSNQVATSVAAKSSKSGQTKVTKKLNKKVKPAKGGVLLRALPDDNIVNGLAVASWTRNDIKAPTAMYVTQDPWCGAQTPPNMGYGPDGVYENNDFWLKKCNSDDRLTGSNGKPGTDAFDYAQVGLVTADLGFTVGTFYPTDANALDGRCYYDPAFGNYRCATDDSQVGPAENLGRGCSETQVDARSPDDVSLVSDQNCQCNTSLSGDNWGQWIQHWLDYAYLTPPKPNYDYFAGSSPSTPFNVAGGQSGKAPMYALDWSSCWLDSPDEIVGLQNALWFNRGAWWNGLLPMQPAGEEGIEDVDGMKYYWGWNEVPVKAAIDRQSNWNAALIHLPAGAGKISDLSKSAKKSLKQQIRDLADSDSGFVIGSKKRGKVAVLKEKYVGNDSWQRKFLCDKHKFGKNLRIDFSPNTKKSNGYCYVR